MFFDGFSSFHPVCVFIPVQNDVLLTVTATTQRGFPVKKKWEWCGNNASQWNAIKNDIKGLWWEGFILHNATDKSVRTQYVIPLHYGWSLNLTIKPDICHKYIYIYIFTRSFIFLTSHHLMKPEINSLISKNRYKSQSWINFTFVKCLITGVLLSHV